MAGKGMPKILSLIRQAQGLDPVEESILKKLTPHVPGIVTFADHTKPLPWHTDYKSVLIFADISGFTALCERYSSMESHGINQLTKTLNDYVGALVRVIMESEGDVLKFAGDAILALWRVNALRDLLPTVEKVISCCLTIQHKFGEWKTGVGITLTVKIGVASGDMRVTFLGNEQFRVYVERGQAVTDVNRAEQFCKSGYIVLSPYTWEICRKTLYQFELLEDKEHVRILAYKDPQKSLKSKSDLTVQDDIQEENSMTDVFLTSYKNRRMTLASSATIKVLSSRTAKTPQWGRAISPELRIPEKTEKSSTTICPEIKEESDKTSTQSDKMASTSTPPPTSQKNLEIPTIMTTDVDEPSDIVKPAAAKGFGKGSSLKLRSVVKQVTEMKLDSALRLFVLPPVLKKLDDNQPLEYLSEMRQVSIVFMNLVLDESFDITKLLQEIFEVVYSQTKALHGSLNKVFLFDKGCTFLVIFGLPGYKHERDCANALFCSFKMRKVLVEVDGVLNVSIGVTTGTTFCGVVGHKNRHEYSVIGRKVNMAARLMMHYPDKVTCDDDTFHLSRLPTTNFTILVTKRMKGLRNIGMIREYQQEDNLLSATIDNIDYPVYPLLGQNEEIRLFEEEIQTLKDSPSNDQYKRSRHLCFAGFAGIGKTRLLSHFMSTAEDMEIRVVSCAVKPDHFLDHYSLVKSMIEKTLASCGYSDHIEKEPVIMDTVVKAGYFPWLYKLNAILGTNFQAGKESETVSELTAEDILCCITQMCAEQHGGLVFVLDDAHFIDVASWKFLNKLSQVLYILVVCAFRPSVLENPPSPDIIEFTDRENVLVKDLGELEEKYMSALACQLMNVVKIPKELEKLLKEWTHRVPSWCEQLLVDMVKKEQLLIILDQGQPLPSASLVAPKAEYIKRLDTDDDLEIELMKCNSVFQFHTKLDNSEELSSGQKLLSDLGFVCDSSAHQSKRIAVFAPGIIPSEIPVPNSMKEWIISRLDSMRASEQLIVKCAAILGVSFSRDMLETILPGMQRVKARKCFKKLVQIGIFECANIPTARYNQVMSGRHESLSWKTCYCPKDSTDYNQDLCDKMRFRNILIQQTAYEVLMESQRLELHAKSAKYLEKKADEYRNKIPYYVLGRQPSEAETERSELKFQIKDKRNHFKSRNQVEDLDLNYWQTRGRRQAFSMDDEYKDPLLKVLRERQVQTEMTTKEQLECLLPTYEMILHHWKAAKQKSNVVDQLLEAIAAAVAVNKPHSALEMLADLENVMETMTTEDDMYSEKTVLMARINRLKAKTYQLIGEDEVAYNNLLDAARLLRLKQPKNNVATKIQQMFQKLRLNVTSNMTHQKKPCTQKSIEQCYCLSELYQFHKKRGNKDLAALNALQFQNKVNSRATLTNQLIEGYSIMIDHCHINGQWSQEIRFGQELLTRCAILHEDLTEDNFRSLARVYTTMCEVSLQQGDISVAIMSGEGAVDLAGKLKDNMFVDEVAPSLAIAYILAKRFDECRKFLIEVKEKTTNSTTLSWYYSMCLELILSGEKAPETFDSCLDFATFSLKYLDAVKGQFSSRYYLAMSVALMHCRKKNWRQAQSWFSYWEYYQTDDADFLSLYAKARKVEIMLLSLSVSKKTKTKNEKLWKKLQNEINQNLMDLKRRVKLVPCISPKFNHLKTGRLEGLL